jgi:hypothetical protein
MAVGKRKACAFGMANRRGILKIGPGEEKNTIVTGVLTFIHEDNGRSRIGISNIAGLFKYGISGAKGKG